MGAPSSRKGQRGFRLRARPGAGSPEPGTVCPNPSHSLVLTQVTMIPGGGPTMGLTKEWASSLLALQPLGFGCGLSREHGHGGLCRVL